EKDLHQIARVTSEIAGFPYHEGTFYPASFGHLFGYDAGYYGYLWSKVYGDDMFSRFEEEGVLDPAVGKAYRMLVLEQGGSKDAADLLRDFLGREPNQAAFLRQLGIG
ncbi:MAG: M3 family metallopeptidase, partial [Acidimicrobiia bacterium]|nr:M3 family metallopeptidase [Acidimicrobiia bacterium]